MSFQQQIDVADVAKNMANSAFLSYLHLGLVLLELEVEDLPDKNKDTV